MYIMRGFVVIARNRETKAVSNVDAVEDVVYSDRLIFCQAVEDIESVRDRILDPDEVPLSQDGDDPNDHVERTIQSVQWIANDYPLRCFQRLKG